MDGPASQSSLDVYIANRGIIYMFRRYSPSLDGLVVGQEGTTLLLSSPEHEERRKTNEKDRLLDAENKVQTSMV